MLDILPRVPVRHYVVTLPAPWRYTLAHDPSALRRVRNAVVQELVAMVEVGSGIADGRGGAVCATHPCGSCFDLNVHLHALVLDGVYTLHEGDSVFHPLADDPDACTLEAVARRVHDRIESLAPTSGGGTRTSAAPPFRRLTIATRVVRGPPLRSASNGSPRGRVAEVAGLRVRAGESVDDRGAVARLAAYLTRSLAVPDALTTGARGTIRYRLLRPFADGTTHVEFAPAELAARLRALGPLGPAPRITWHGVLAPHAAHRRHVVPRQLELDHVSTPPRARKLTRPRSLPPRRDPPCPDCGEPMQLVGVEAVP